MTARLFALFALATLTACGSPPPPQAMETPPEVQRALDQNELLSIATGLDDAVDRKDWTQTLGYFDEEVDVDFTSLGGQPGRIPKAGLVGNWKAALTAEKQSFHLRGDSVVKITGDSATMLSHGYAWNRLTTRKTNDLWEVWGVYEHRFIRTDGIWKINGLKFVKTYERGDPSVRAAAATPENEQP
jgi:SnoaL-like domain